MICFRLALICQRDNGAKRAWVETPLIGVRRSVLGAMQWDKMTCEDRREQRNLDSSKEPRRNL
jgi:hypothetical protein